MTKLDSAWARTQVEAMVDGNLSEAAEQRMRALIDDDPALAAEVERARGLRRELKALRRVPVPRGLGSRLWRIPNRERPRVGITWVPATGIAAVAALALTVSILFGIEGQRPSEEQLAREAAIQDFAIAMAYLQKSALVARNEVNEAVGAGVMDAWAAGRDAIGQTGLESDEGE
jgi:anti-sigma factor RsiW